ncbi:MAG TPA: cytochrome c [Candidatus Lambdaproteobacteria bacterium]|jgi:mono/diheme cytochrome c family protein|nr:cytochrome c [Candidatus Lambdaproteobacteria bacterium]HIO10179.1 cytochrome c [Deltaproteobacteria bacterium]
MKKIISFIVLSFLFVITASSTVFAGTVEEEFKIEGLISPASPKALKSALEKELDVKVINLNLKSTKTGWPVLRVQFDSGSISKEKIEKVIGEIEDPAGHKYKVHHGPLLANAPLLDEEQQAIALLGDTPVAFPNMKNPITDKAASASRGEKLFVNNCVKCHGFTGNGYGTVAHGFTTWPRQLWAWNNTGPETDGYLFWFITNGRSDMPPWGLILSENERWDLINYIKTIKNPETD